MEDEEIRAAVDVAHRDRGLRFDAKMVPYCGKIFRVRSRVERLIDEKTGRMTRLSNDSIVLDGVVCQARFSARRLFCPRGIVPYWREVWPERIDDPCRT